MPDDALFSAAEDGSLLTAEGYRAQVTRLATDARARRGIEEFYRDYFRVQDIPDLRTQDGEPRFYHGGPDGYGNTTNRNDLAMQAELANLGLWYTFDAPGTFEEMFRSNLHFLECQPPRHRPDSCYGAGPYSAFAYGIEGCEGGGGKMCTQG